METEVLSYRSHQILERVWDTVYAPIGWKIKSPIEKKWSWRQFRYMYVMVLEREPPKTLIESVENASEINTCKYRFTANDRKNNFHEKVFYAPKDFNQQEEFKKWLKEKAIN